MIITELTAKLKAERKASRLWERLDDAARNNAQQMRNIALESLVALDKAEILNADLTEALEAAEKVSAARLEAIDRAHKMFQRQTDRAEAAEKRIAELEARTLTVKLPDEIRDGNNQFLIVRHPGKVPVIKHPSGELEDYVLRLFMDDPNATIDIVTHRYYGVGGQWVQCADEYLQEGGIKLQIEGE